MIKLNNKLLFGIVSLLLFLKVFVFEKRPAEFESFLDLAWPNSQACVNEILTNIDSGSEGLRLGPSQDLNTKVKSFCESEAFLVSSSHIRLFYSFISPLTNSNAKFALILSSIDGGFSKKVQIPYLAGKSWKPLMIDLPESDLKTLKTTSVKFSVYSNEELDRPYLQIRDRIEFLSEDPVVDSKSVLSVDLLGYIRVALCVAVLLLLANSVGDCSRVAFFGSLLAVVFTFHFKLNPFFYFDEWHIMQRFSEREFLDAVLYTHNEHFLPFFFAVYYWQMKIFGGNYHLYLIFSCILIAVYGYVVQVFLKGLSFNLLTSRLLALLFCASSLHAEVAQWSLEQCILISSILGVISLNCLLTYLKDRRLVSLFIAGICMFLSPLAFGGGFTYFPIAMALGLLFLVFMRERRNFKSTLASLALAGALMSFSIAIPFGLYVKFKEASSGHAVDQESFFKNKKQFIAYFFQGTGVGSILRPLGVYPTLSIRSPQEIVQEVVNLKVDKIDPTLSLLLLPQSLGWCLLERCYLYLGLRISQKANLTFLVYLV